MIDINDMVDFLKDDITRCCRRHVPIERRAGTIKPLTNRHLIAEIN